MSWRFLLPLCRISLTTILRLSRRSAPSRARTCHSTRSAPLARSARGWPASGRRHLRQERAGLAVPGDHQRVAGPGGGDEQQRASLLDLPLDSAADRCLEVRDAAAGITPSLTPATIIRWYSSPLNRCRVPTCTASGLRGPSGPIDGGGDPVVVQVALHLRQQAPFGNRDPDGRTMSRPLAASPSPGGRSRPALRPAGVAGSEARGPRSTDRYPSRVSMPPSRSSHSSLPSSASAAVRISWVDAVAERQPRRAAAYRYPEAAEGHVVVVDPLVGVAGQEQVVRARARPWRAAASSAPGSGPAPRPPRRAGSGSRRRRAGLARCARRARRPGGTSTGSARVSRLVNCSTSCQTSARCTRLRVRPRPARRARKYSSRESSAWPRTTWDHSSCRNRASQLLIAQLEQHVLPQFDGL